MVSSANSQVGVGFGWCLALIADKLQAKVLVSPKITFVSFANAFDEKLQSFLACRDLRSNGMDYTMIQESQSRRNLDE